MTRTPRNPRYLPCLAALVLAATLAIPGLNLPGGAISGQALAAAKTYNSKGNQENTRNLFETCRLRKVERDEETRCIYRRQSGGNDVVISNEDPNVPCQRQFQCKRTE
ncbi:hypothetical protein AB8880_08185 [Alphaproteobacteria bacterium LSUCC0684]